ncbi:MAG TPA: hypothetical protein VIK66_02745 [Gaiellaceae bacterium]|jgi:hypothetical protein
MKKLLLIAAAAVAALVLSAQAVAAQPRFITDTLAPGGGTAAPQQVQGYRFITDTLAPGGGTSTAPVDSPGFDWSDAGVGALTAVGVVLVLAGAALTAVRRRTVVTS